MAEKTAIAWTDHTFNPWIGCTKVGPGCDHCYAEVRDARRQWDGGKVHWGAGVPRYRTSQSNWNDVNKWDRKAKAAGVRRRVFCASLADVFDNEVSGQWRMDLWDLIFATPNLSWLLVTKRIGNVERMASDAMPSTEKPCLFPPNVRLLITVCNQEEADRDIPKLLALPCRNGISYEPALGPIDWSPWLSPKGHINWGENENPSERDQRAVLAIAKAAYYKLGGHLLEWIIVGGESTQGAGKARPFDLAWARSTVAQCKAAGVPVFVKQLGSAPVGDWRWEDSTQFDGWPRYGKFKDRHGADPAEWPEDLRVREFPEAPTREFLSRTALNPSAAWPFPTET